MGATVMEDLAGDKFTIKRMSEGDILGSEGPEAADTVLFLVGLGTALLSRQESGGGPGGAQEDAGGLVAGGHGGELAVINGRADILGFVDGEECGGGGAGGLGDGTAAEEMDESLIQADNKACLGAPATGGEGIAVEAALEAADGIETLGFQGGGNRNDLDILPGKKA